ncbi:hypothetical protein GOODEAATRI_006098, partial [Goodea atripinnis]
LEELCDGLSRQAKGLKVLILKNNQITERGMNHLAKTLSSDQRRVVRRRDPARSGRCVPLQATWAPRAPNTPSFMHQLINLQC